MVGVQEHLGAQVEAQVQAAPEAEHQVEAQVQAAPEAEHQVEAQVQAAPKAEPQVEPPVKAEPLDDRLRCAKCDCVIDKKRCAVCASIDCKRSRGYAMTPHVRFAALAGKYSFDEVIARKRLRKQ